METRVPVEPRGSDKPRENPASASLHTLHGRVASDIRAPFAMAEIIIRRPLYRTPVAVVLADQDGRFEVPGLETGWHSVWFRGVGFSRSSSATFWVEREVELEAWLPGLRVSETLRALTAQVQIDVGEGYGAARQVELIRESGATFRSRDALSQVDATARIALAIWQDAGIVAPEVRRHHREARQIWSEVAIEAGRPLVLNLSGATGSGPLVAEELVVSGADASAMRLLHELRWRHQRTLLSPDLPEADLEEALSLIFGEVDKKGDLSLSRLTRLGLVSGLRHASPRLILAMLEKVPPDAREWGADDWWILLTFFRPDAPSDDLRRYLEAVIETNSQSGVIASCLQVQMHMARRAGDEASVRRAVQQLASSRFDGTSAAFEAQMQFSEASPLAIGKRLPRLSVAGLEGGQISTESFLGREYLLVFWASWCSFCEPQMEAFHATHKGMRAAGRDLEFFFISFDATVDAVVAFRKQWPMPWIHGIATSDEQEFLLSTWGFVGVPTAILVDSDGCIRGVTQDIRDKAFAALLGPLGPPSK